MRVHEVMSHQLITVRPTDSLKTAEEKMGLARCRHLPVVDEAGTLVGILSDRDCRLAHLSPATLRESWQDEAVLEQTPVEAFMSHEVLTIESSATVGKAALLLLNNRINALPVMKEGRLIGMVTSSDLLKALIADEAKIDEPTF